MESGAQLTGGLGEWTIDAQHWSRPLTSFASELYVPLINQASAKTVKRFGVLLAYQVRVVNRFLYSAPRQMVSDRSELAGGLRIDMSQIATAAKRTIDERLWRSELRRWDMEVKPQALHHVRDALATNPRDLSSEELVAYLEKCRELLAEMSRHHDDFQFAASFPVGRFLARAEELVGLTTKDGLDLLSGFSPSSSGSTMELLGLLAAIRRSEEAQQAITADQPTELFARLRQISGTAAATRLFLEVDGYRLVTGFDVGDLYALEVPHLLAYRVREALESTEHHAQNGVGLDSDGVRRLVPYSYKPEFDELLREAREAYRLRDERGLYTDIWAAGVMRRALLAAGERLASGGRIDAPEHIVEASFNEIRSLIRSGAGPDASELRSRYRFRMTHTWMDSSRRLQQDCLEEQIAWHPEELPAEVGQILKAILTYVSACDGATREKQLAGSFVGTGIGRGSYQGYARVVRHPQDIARLRAGDVLVTSLQSAGLNTACALTGALVADTGGQLSHAAVIARERRIPAVMGCTDATWAIPDGSQVWVDADAGTVTF